MHEQREITIRLIELLITELETIQHEGSQQWKMGTINGAAQMAYKLNIITADEWDTYFRRSLAALRKTA